MFYTLFSQVYRCSMNDFSIQIDPLDSPYPIPWSWVQATQFATEVSPHLRYYRTQALVSPDGVYAAYSRIQMQVERDFTQSQVSSVLFIENLQTGDFQTIPIDAPFAENPFGSYMEAPPTGAIAIVIPVAWSARSDRLLAREFESVFGSGMGSDFAVVWDRSSGQVSTIAPGGISYTNAVLLGWSQTHPDRVLFRAGELGDPEWRVWSVDTVGHTNPAFEDHPIGFGQTMTHLWAGPQATRS